MNSPFITAKQALLGNMVLLVSHAYCMESFWVEKVLDDSVKFSPADSVLVKAYLSNKAAGLLSESSPASNLEHTPHALPKQQDADGRERVSDTTQFPYCSIGHLIRNLSQDVCKSDDSTGFLAGPQHFVTTAHSLYKINEVKYGTQWPPACTIWCGINSYGQHLKGLPKDFVQAARLFVPRAYIEHHNKDYDFALIVLKEPIGIHKRWLGCMFTDDNTILKENLTITGYPGDLPRIDIDPLLLKPINTLSLEEQEQLDTLQAEEQQEQTDSDEPIPRLQGWQQWTMSGSAKSVTEEKIYYTDIMTSESQSGSPIYITAFNGMPYAIGVHTDAEPPQGFFKNLFGRGPGRSGVRFTESKFHHLMDAIGQTGMIIIAIPKTPSNSALLINFQKELVRRKQEQELNETNRKEWRKYDLEWYRDEPVSIQNLQVKAIEKAEHDAKHQGLKRLETDFMQKWAALKTQSAEK